METLTNKRVKTMKQVDKDLTTLDEIIWIAMHKVAITNFSYIKDSDEFLDFQERIEKLINNDN